MKLKAFTEPLLRYQEKKENLSSKELTLPDDTLHYSVRHTIEREFLIDPKKIILDGEPETEATQGWLRITRLPVSPFNDKNFALYPKWQNMIATVHTLQYRLCYVLQRINGETKLSVGAIPTVPDITTTSSAIRAQLKQSIENQLPGIGLTNLNAAPGFAGFSYCGAVTGIPSIRKITEYGEYQTMDQIAMGLRANGEERNFAVVITADPISDEKITKIQRSLENIGAEVHALTQYHKTESVNNNENVSFSEHMGASINKLLCLSASAGTMEGVSVGSSDAVTVQYINKSAAYCEELIDHHLQRLKAGRSLGFWKTGVYVLADSEPDARTVMGMLRASYSGDNTYTEPIRTTLLPNRARKWIALYGHVPLKNEAVRFLFGETHEDLATPITTEELSIAASLPRRDVAGLRLIRNAARFSANPPPLKDTASVIRLGNILDIGSQTSESYRLDLNQLTRHTLVAGTNGSGKTTTCLSLLANIIRAEVPFLVIEPAKTEYVEWALEWNRTHPDRRIAVYAPGNMADDDILPLSLNPFQPAAPDGAWINMLGHLDRFKSVLMNSMPMADVLPLIMEEALFATATAEMDVSKTSRSGNIDPMEDLFKDTPELSYPLIEKMVNRAALIVSGRGYDYEIEQNIIGAVRTRISSMMLGWKKKLFNVTRSTDFKALFEKNTVINLSHLTDDRDKAFVMSMLLIALAEYRESQYVFNAEYKKNANKNRLMHLTLIEEAHRLMPDIAENTVSGINSQYIVSKMFSNILSEIRAYGEGCVIADQVPTRLIPDAIKNTNLKMIHRLTSSDDIKAVSAGMRLRNDQEFVVGSLQQGEALICSDFDDMAAWVKIEPYASDRNASTGE